MPSHQQNYYEILGLPRNASTAEIKKRYREIVRKYHPDVAGKRALSSSAFARLTEAYKTLSDPVKRRAYDASLMDVTQRINPPAASSHTASSSIHSTQRQSVRSDITKLIKEAEVAFIKRRLEQAADLCKQAIKINNSSARAHAILGDIFRAKHMPEHAIKEYTFAVQFDPADRESQKKLEKLLERLSPVKMTWEDKDRRMSNSVILLNIIGWTFAVFILLLLNIVPGRPISWLESYRLTFVIHWSWNLVGIMFGDALLVGFLLSANGLLEHPDDELIYERGASGWVLIPSGVLLLIFGPLFFIGAAGLYLLLGFIQNSISKSLIKLFAVIGMIVLISAALYPADKISILIFGGNVAFIGAMIGWYLGSMLGTER